MMYPVKYNSKFYNDKRGYLREITPRKLIVHLFIVF